MKYTKLFPLIFLLAACNGGFHKLYTVDATTGAELKGDGLSCDDVSFRANGKKLNALVFTEGEEMDVVFENVVGLKRVKDIAEPGLELIVRNSQSKIVFHEKDLFKNEKTSISPLELTASFSCGLLDSKQQETFKLYVKIWDKKGSGVLTLRVPFTVKAYSKMNISESGLKADKIYLWNETKKVAITDNVIPRGDDVMLLINNASGFVAIDSLVRPALSFYCTDNTGVDILANDNMYDDIPEEGIEMKEEDNQIHVTFSFSEGIVHNPMKIKAVLTDLNSEKKLQIETSIRVK